MNAMDPLPLYAARTPKKPAIVTASETVTYEELDRRTDRVAAGLLRLGLPPGSVVPIMVPTGIPSVVSTIAVMKAGLVYTGLNVMFRAFEVEQIAADSQARAVIVHVDFLDVVDEVRCRVPSIEHVVVVGTGRQGEVIYDELLERPADGPQTQPLNPALTAALFYTGGTTGTPKGVVHDHANIAIQMQKSRALAGLHPEDRMLGIIPTFIGTSFIAAAWVAIANGATTYLQERMDAASAADWVEEEKLTFFWATVANVQRFNDLAHDRDMSSITRAITGGFAHPPAIREEFEQRFGARLYLGFGMSEVVNTVTLQPRDDEARRRQKYESVGVPAPGLVAAILDDDGNEVKPGEHGELCLRDDGRGTWKPMLGYLNRPQETAEALAGGWLHTNDLAHMDKDGWIYVHGRRGDLLKVSGYQLFAAEIENVINDDERVHHVAVAGVADPRATQRPVAWVKLNDGANMTKAEVLELVEHRLARFKHLKDAVFVDELPTNFYGKVQKHVLVARYEAQADLDRTVSE
jgi:acyl-CoA synthetase (AMP-forming)/AMP-acid ligase II